MTGCSTGWRTRGSGDGAGRPYRDRGAAGRRGGRDADFVSVLALWDGRPDIPVTQSLVRLLADEAVPFLAAYRYKDSGLRKREPWEQTWAAAAARGRRREGRADPGAAEVHDRGLPQEVVLAGAGQARRAEGAVHPVPESGAGDRSDAAARLGRVGPRPAGAGAVAGLGERSRTAGTTTGSSRWWPGWPSCSRGCTSGTPRWTRPTGSAWRRSAGNSSPSGPPRSARPWTNWPPGARRDHPRPQPRQGRNRVTARRS